MENIEKQLNQFEKSLEDKLKALDVLEAEKLDIMERYVDADEKSRATIEKEMKASEEKFKILAEETLALKEKIKKLKKKGEQ